MKAWLVAASLAMCLLFGIVSAQTYSIRVTYHTNLRASFSLESAFIETVPPGTTLQVVGNNNRWLRINRNGNDVWMADWVPYTRVEGSEATPEQATGDIDNCCFVDRHCQRDQDWIAGYWAFQNNQCVAPAQSQPGTSAPPASNASAQIDNCCFVDRQCHSDLDWINGYHAFENHQCGAPGQSPASASSHSASGVIQRTASGIVIGNPNGRGILLTTSPSILPDGQSSARDKGNCCEWAWQCNNEQDWAEGFSQFQTHFHCALPGQISIVGDADFIDFYAQRLDELKNRLPHRYDYVLNGLNKIEQLGLENTVGHVEMRHRAFHVGWDGPLVNGWEKRRSAVLVHEACHLHRHDAGQTANICDREAWIREEVFCRELELQVVIELDTQPDVTEWVRGMVERTRSGETYWRPQRICD